MAQPSDRTDAPTRDEERPEPLSFTLQVVSPSVGVSMPLVFPQLLATTSIKELKAKIRAVLPSHPTDENQRLIHRGRMLGNENETMADVFGRDTLQQPQSQTLHLVLRPIATDGPPPPTQPVTNIPAPPAPTPFGLPNLPQIRPDQGAHRAQPSPFEQLAAIHEARRQEAMQRVEQTNQNLTDHLANMQQQQERLLHQIERFENQFRTMRDQPHAQTPPPRASNPHGGPEGVLHGHHDPRTMNAPGLPFPSHMFAHPREANGPNGEHRAVQGNHQSPHQHHLDPNEEGTVSILREEVGPNGERRVVQHNYQAPRDQFGNHRAPTEPMVPILREQVEQNGERIAMQDNMQAPFLRQPNGQPGTSHALPHGVRSHNVVTYMQEEIGPNGERTVVRQQIVNGHPVEPGHILANGARYTHNPIPDLMAHVQARARAARSPHRLAGQGPGTMERSASNPAIGNPPVVQGVTSAATGTNTPTGHSSGHVHRHLNSNTASTASLRDPSGAPTVYLLSSPSGPRALLVTNQETFYSRSSQTPPRTAPYPHEHVQPDNLNRQGRGGRRNDRQEGADPAIHIGAPHANPPAAALGARVFPLLWLVVRLVGFVWFFTSGNPSWSRWLMISTLAFAVFIFNIGIFNGIAHDIWAPFRAHLEALIPLAGPDAALIPAQNAAPVPQVGPAPVAHPAPRRGELNEHEFAARLIEQRRQQNGWLMTHIRRVEHSLLLFMASLIPGVGERHIAAREAEANERQRLIDESAAATAAAEAAEAAENETAVAEGGVIGEEGQQLDGEVPREEAPVAAPLIDV